MLFEGRRKPGEMSRRYRLFRQAMTLLCRVLFGYKVHGGNRVPSDGPLVVASNHSQYADPVLVCVAVPRRLQWMARCPRRPAKYSRRNWPWRAMMQPRVRMATWHRPR